MARSHRCFLAVTAIACWTVGFVGVPAQAAPAYSITLTAEPTTLETGESSTLTTTANQDLTGTRWATYVFDQTDPTWYRTCKVQTCSFSVSHAAPGSRSYIAYIARDRADPRYPPMQIQATSNTVTVTWTRPTFTVSLAAEETWVAPGSTVVLTATANRDVAGRSLAIQIFDLTIGERIASCASGTTCSADVGQLTPATRAYQAFVAEPGSTAPPPNTQASSEIVTVTWSVLPDPTRPPNAGGGPLTGMVAFSGAGLPPVGADCSSTSFHFDGLSASAWVNGSGAAYVGPLVVAAEGGSACERATAGDGTLTVMASGTNHIGQELTCGPLAGTYTRVLSAVTIIVAGDCTIDGFPAVRVSFVATGKFVPTNQGGGLTGHVTEAAFAGAFTVVPD